MLFRMIFLRNPRNYRRSKLHGSKKSNWTAGTDVPCQETAGANYMVEKLALTGTAKATGSPEWYHSSPA